MNAPGWRTTIPLVVCLCCLAATGLAGPKKITSGNWSTHPRIKEVRAVYRAVQQGLKRRNISCKTRSVAGDRPHQDSARELCTDGHGVARKYVRSGGSDDSATTRAFYYDVGGRLRFLFVTAGAVNGTRVEHRVYFDLRGKRLWEKQKLVKGPGYTFPRTWPAADVVRKPRVAFGRKKKAPPRRWRAVVAIIDRHENGSEDWGWFCADITKVCVRSGAFVSSADARRPRAVLGPPGAPLDELDMSSLIAKKGQGWVLVDHRAGKTTTTFLAYDIANKKKAQAFCARGARKKKRR